MRKGLCWLLHFESVEGAAAKWKVIHLGVCSANCGNSQQCPHCDQQETSQGRRRPTENRDLKTHLLCPTPVDWVFPYSSPHTLTIFLKLQKKPEAGLKKIFSGVLWIDSKDNCWNITIHKLSTIKINGMWLHVDLLASFHTTNAVLLFWFPWDSVFWNYTTICTSLPASR